MATTRIANATASDLTNAISDYVVTNKSTDGATGQKEYEWINTNWSKWLGYYKTIPELRAVIDAKATWTIGKGFKTQDAKTKIILENIHGHGKDTFNTILENAIRTMQIGGDAFIEIMRDDEGDILNLKSLDPSTIKIISNGKGQIIRYEQVSKVEKNKPAKRLDTLDIFHLSRNRTADEIHGISLIESLEQIILMRNEAMTDLKEVYHRFVKPKFIFHLDTDDPTEIASFKSKMDTATGKGENMYIPLGAVVPENLSVSSNATLNPLPWITSLNNYFFQVAGVPQIILGGSGEFTEATAKIAYLAFQQNVEEDQLFIEEQIKEQLFIEIELEFPVSLENELLSDRKKDGDFSNNNMGFQANETTAGAGQ